MKTGNIILIAILCFSTATVWAQKEKKKPLAKGKEESKPGAAKVANTSRGPVAVYLGHSDIRNGNVSKRMFDSLLRQGLVAKDSLGTQYHINGFNFTYAERNLYEDSAAKLMVLTDYALEYCIGDTVSPSISSIIYDHSKAGDTVFIDKVTVTAADSTILPGKGMKLVITK